MELVLSYKLLFAITAVALAIAAMVPYILSIKAGETKPPYSTYLGWTLIGVTMTLFQIQAVQAGESLWSVIPIAAFAVISLTILVTMIKARVKWTWESRDRISFLGIGVCWAIWVSTHYFGDVTGLTTWLDEGQALLFIALLPSVALALTDGFSSWPTFVQCLRGQQSGKAERWSWTLTALSSLFGLASVAEFQTTEIFIPLYVTCYMCAIAAASLLSTPEAENAAHPTPAE